MAAACSGDGEPKYLNSPETALFHKGKELYGLYETRLARQALKRLMVVEGYMDTVRLHQAGVTYAVATLGTATTAEHLRRAFRLVSEIVFCFDGDRAGRAAAWRALQQVLPEAREGREIRFLFLPDGEDPDSLVGREGAERFEARLDGALPLSEYLVAQLLEQADVSHADGKAHFVALARPLLERIAPGIYRELLLERVAAAISLPAARLRAMGEPGQQRRRPQHRRARTRGPLRADGGGSARWAWQSGHPVHCAAAAFSESGGGGDRRHSELELHGLRAARHRCAARTARSAALQPGHQHRADAGALARPGRIPAIRGACRERTVGAGCQRRPGPNCAKPWPLLGLGTRQRLESLIDKAR